MGAGLDVFQDEPYYGKMLGLNNVVLIPQIGAYAREIRMKMEIEPYLVKKDIDLQRVLIIPIGKFYLA